MEKLAKYNYIYTMKYYTKIVCTCFYSSFLNQELLFIYVKHIIFFFYFVFEHFFKSTLLTIMAKCNVGLLI